MTDLELLDTLYNQWDETQWCQKELALDATGHRVDPWASEACQWCLMGKLEAVVETEAQYQRLLALFEETIGPTYRHSLTIVNDRLGWAFVKAIIGNTIGRLRPQGR